MTTSLPSVLFLVATAVPASAGAPGSGFEGVLKELYPVDRTVQVCHLALEDRIAAETEFKRIDRVAPDVAEDSKVAGHTYVAAKAAFRNDDRWYKVRFRCTVDGDYMHAVRLDYEILSRVPIPDAKWDRYRLYH